MRVITLDGDLAAGDLNKLVDAIFPSPHPPVENVRAVGEGLDLMMRHVVDSIKNDKPFKINLENRANELNKRPTKTTPAQQPVNKGGRPAKKKPAEAPAPAAAAPAKF